MGSFDNIDHDTLLNILRRDIKDDRFLKLIREMLRAGYLQDWKYQCTYSGVPQGGVISPILSNIILNELDKFIEQELIPAYTRGDKREINQEYRKIANTMFNMTRKKSWDKAEYRKLDKIRKQTPSKNTHDPGFRRLRYVRYADDFLLGFIGPKAEAEEIKEKIKQFLSTINLTLSAEKTLITHATTQKARFLGYEIQTAQEDARWSKKTAKLRKRSINGQIILGVPDEAVRDWQKKYSKAGKPIARARFIACSDYEIVQTYGIELRGLVNYYQLAANVSTKLYPVKYWMEQSLVKTLAAKHKQKVTWVYRNYKVKTEQGLGAIRVVVPNPNNSEKPLTAQFAGISIETRPNASITDDIKTLYHGRNELVRRLLANECELCGSNQEIRVHHLHQLKDIKKKYTGRTLLPPWAAFMIKRNRKTIVVCQECHRKIHKGNYDGKKVTQTC